MSYCDDSDYALGIVPQKMATLKKMNIAPPDQVVYRPYSSYYVRSDLSRIGDGFASVEWIWDTISIARLSQVLDFLDGEDNAVVYVYTDKRDGTFPNPKSSFSLFSALMWKPLVSGEEGVFVAKSPYVVQTLSIKFVRMVEISDAYLVYL